MAKDETKLVHKTAEEVRRQVVKNMVMTAIEYVSGTNYTGNLTFHILDGNVEKVEYHHGVSVSKAVSKITMGPLP